MDTRKHLIRKFVIVVAIWSLISILPLSCYAQNYEQKYFFIKEKNTYRLTVSVTPSLYEYYHQKEHPVFQDQLAGYVTPYSLALIAEDIRSVFTGEEEFINAVLMLVHQITYRVMDAAKYPVETLVENEGDCDLLSFIAASLIKSQDMEVILLLYEQESHMNIGINLPSPPKDTRTEISYIENEGVRYYIAECTGNNWQNGWRIGECPPELEGAQITVISLDGYEQSAPGQVSSSFGNPETSTISLAISSNIILEGSDVVLSGQVSVSNPSGLVTLYISTQNNWIAIGNESLDSIGRYEFLWSTRIGGYYSVKASWPGNEIYAGADSTIVSIFIIPKFVILIGVGLFTLIITYVVLKLKNKKMQDNEFFEISENY